MNLKVWWLNSGQNFGDILTPYILKYFGIEHTFVHNLTEANLICIGSIIRRARKGMTVLGSGIMNSHDRISTEADFRLVRGKLSRKRIVDLGGTCPDRYGDPALLVPLIAEEKSKKYKIGYIPHVVHWKEFNNLLPGEKIIRLRTDDPIRTAQEISECEYIVSSSLHGIIVANAYGIPAAWVESTQTKIKGDGSKFHDYFSSVGIEHTISTINNPSFNCPDTIDTNNIKESFYEFKELINEGI